MQFSHQQIRQYLRESEFEDLFIDELGWDNYTDTHRCQFKRIFVHVLLKKVLQNRGTSCIM